MHWSSAVVGSTSHRSWSAASASLAWSPSSFTTRLGWATVRLSEAAFDVTFGPLAGVPVNVAFNASAPAVCLVTFHVNVVDACDARVGTDAGSGDPIVTPDEGVGVTALGVTFVRSSSPSLVTVAVRVNSRSGAGAWGVAVRTPLIAAALTEKSRVTELAVT